MANALVPLAEGFEELEAVTIVDILRRGGVTVTVAGLSAQRVRGSHDIWIEADVLLDAAVKSSFDAVVLPGGTQGAQRLREDPRVLGLVRDFAAAGKLTAAVCAAPTVLETAGILQGKRATSYPGNALPSAHYEEARVVEDGQVITSRGPGTAIEFALTVVARLVNQDTADKVRRAMLVQ